MTERSRGQIKLRSNVVIDGGRWDLVPGELFHKWRRREEATRLQHEEHMYYEPCSVCQRPIVRIELEGCTQCPYAPTPEQVDGHRARHARTIEEAKQHEAHENAAFLPQPSPPGAGDPSGPAAGR